MKTADRVQDTSSAPGTGSVTVSGSPPSGYQAFGTAFVTGDVIYYTMVAGSLWEVGIGTMTSSTAFSRDTVLDGSSGAGTFVNFTGSTTVFADFPAYAVKRGRWGLMLANNYNWMLP